MEFLELVRKRRSVRAFAARAVAAESLEAVLEAARRAPSAGNLQAYQILVVREAARKRVLARAAFHQTFLAGAAVVLVFFGNPQRSGRKYGGRGHSLYALQDATLACAYAQLAATAAGLSSCWVGAFDDDEVRAALGAPAHLIPIAILPIGHAAESPGETGRRSMAELVAWDRF